MWLMILIAVHVTDPKDMPARVTLEFPNQAACEHAQQSLQYWVKFDSFKVEAKCAKKTS